jgi:hypothetical protein
MTTEQLLIGILTVVFGGGGLAGIFGVFVTRKLGIKTHENEANRDMNTTWDAIVENLQGQIDQQSTLFTNQIKELHAEISTLKTGYRELEALLGLKERIILKAIAFINKLEALIPEEKRPARPTELE